MSKFDDILSDLKALTDEGVRKASEAYEISKLKLEKLKVNQRISENYERLGEIVYGGYKNKEDVSDVTAVIYEQLDDDFARIEEIYSQINEIKSLYGDKIEEAGEEDEEEYEVYVDDDDEEEDSVIDEIKEKAEDAFEDVKEKIEEIKEDIEEDSPKKAKVKGKKNSKIED